MKRLLILNLLVLTGCATGSAVQYTTDVPCETVNARLDGDFSGAGMAGCAITKDGRFLVQIAPEKELPINPSPWYAVRLTPKQPSEVDITFHYTEHTHRYWPKISTNAKTWTRIKESDVDISSNEKRLSVKLVVDDTPVFLAGQELFLNTDYDIVLSKLSAMPSVERRAIGQSREGRTIDLAQSNAGDDGNKYILLVGRQHPPEVTGGIAMIAFISTIMSDTELAKRFRGEFNILMVPNMNPDGVENGHWRLNMGGVDLNRDWGPFTQQETQAIRRLLDEQDEKGSEILLFLDFHSTKRNVFYTQTVEAESTPYDFTGKWMKNGGDRLPEYEFERAERHNTELPTSKNYMALTYNIPAITYELGDETDRALIKKSANVFAEEMMKLLLMHHGGA